MGCVNIKRGISRTQVCALQQSVTARHEAFVATIVFHGGGIQGEVWMRSTREPPARMVVLRWLRPRGLSRSRGDRRGMVPGDVSRDRDDARRALGWFAGQVAGQQIAPLIRHAGRAPTSMRNAPGADCSGPHRCPAVAGIGQRSMGATMPAARWRSCRFCVYANAFLGDKPRCQAPASTRDAVQAENENDEVGACKACWC